MKTFYERVKELGEPPDYKVEHAKKKVVFDAKYLEINNFKLTAKQRVDALAALAGEERKWQSPEALDYLKKYSSIIDQWDVDLRNEYADITDKAYGIIHAYAYDRGHSAGHDEVALYMKDYLELFKTIETQCNVKFLYK
jgi:flagellar biosynthesis/type III secretory pathway protein FliH